MRTAYPFRLMITTETGEVFRHEGSPDFESEDEAHEWMEANDVRANHPECSFFMESMRPTSESYGGFYN